MSQIVKYQLQTQTGWMHLGNYFSIPTFLFLLIEITNKQQNICCGFRFSKFCFYSKHVIQRHLKLLAITFNIKLIDFIKQFKKIYLIHSIWVYIVDFMVIFRKSFRMMYLNYPNVNISRYILAFFSSFH